jgi:hypothetical protein
MENGQGRGEKGRKEKGVGELQRKAGCCNHNLSGQRDQEM